MTVGELYRTARTETAKPPAGWPAAELREWAAGALRAAVAPIDAESLPLAWTGWRTPRHPSGLRHSGPWSALCAYLHRQAKGRTKVKGDAPCWGPATYGESDGGQNYRNQEGVEQICALVLDCDDQGDWPALLALLDAEGLAYLAHRTPSHLDGGPCKWRLVLPLSSPVQGADLARWPSTYTLARVALAALGCCWFDTTCGETARCFFGPVAVGDAPPREVVARPGQALDLAALVALAPAEPARVPKVAPAKLDLPGGGDWDLRTFDLVQWAKDAGLYLTEAKRERRHHIVCPWRERHTGGKQGPTDTFVGEAPGAYLYCAHASCKGHGLRDLAAELSEDDKARYCQRRLPSDTWLADKLWRRCGPVTSDPAAAAWLLRQGIDPAAVAVLDLARVLPVAAVDLPRWASSRRGEAWIPWTESGHRLVLRAWAADPEHPGRLRWTLCHAVALPDGALSTRKQGVLWAAGADPGGGLADPFPAGELVEGSAAWLRRCVELVEGPAAWLRRCVDLAGKAAPFSAVWGIHSTADLATVAAAVPMGWPVRNPPAAMLDALKARGSKVRVSKERRLVDPPLSSPVQPCPAPAAVDLVAVAVKQLRASCYGAEVAQIWMQCCWQAGGAELVAPAIAEAHRLAVAGLDGWELNEHGAELRQRGMA